MNTNNFILQPSLGNLLHQVQESKSGDQLDSMPRQEQLLQPLSQILLSEK